MVCVPFSTHCSRVLAVSGAWVGRWAASTVSGRSTPSTVYHRGACAIAVWELHTEFLGGQILACIVAPALQFGNRIQVSSSRRNCLQAALVCGSSAVLASSFHLSQVRRMAGESEISAGVALPPPDDEFVSGSGTGVPEQVGEAGAALSGVYDSYDGVIVDPRSLPMDGSKFKQLLMASIAQWRRERKHGIWLKLPIKKVNLVEAAVAAGFRYHHAEPTYLMLTLWLPDRPCTLPPNASHQVGIGAFVLNDKNEILVVQEKTGPLRGTGVWKWPTGLTNLGEDIFDGAVREVKEETGVDAQFLEVVGFRQGHQVAFDKSDLFFLCILRPTSTKVAPQESEIAAAKWMPISEFQAQPVFHQRPTLHKMLDVCLARAQGRCRGFAYDKINPDRLNPSSYFYYNQVDLLDEQGQTKP